jgi:glucosamine-6-phosphate deaminase
MIRRATVRVNVRPVLACRMRIRIAPDATSHASEAADAVCEHVRRMPGASIALPTGSTPIRMYAELNRRAATRAVDMSGMTVWAIDEFAGVSRATRGTNSVFYREHVRFHPRSLHVPNPAAEEPDEHIRAFAGAIERAGGLDLCVLGIGVNGHIAFNEPGSAPHSGARVVELHEESRRAHAEAFGGIERVPERGMTLGVADLLSAHFILVLATGERKADIVRRAIEEPARTEVPASWLQGHGDVTWLLDASAAADLRDSVTHA